MSAEVHGSLLKSGGCSWSRRLPVLAASRRAKSSDDKAGAESEAGLKGKSLPSDKSLPRRYGREMHKLLLSLGAFVVFFNGQAALGAVIASKGCSPHWWGCHSNEFISIYLDVCLGISSD